MDTIKSETLGLKLLFDLSQFYAVVSKSSFDENNPLVYLVLREALDPTCDDIYPVQVFYSDQDELRISSPDKLCPVPVIPSFLKDDLILIEE